MFWRRATLALLCLTATVQSTHLPRIPSRVCTRRMLGKQSMQALRLPSTPARTGHKLHGSAPPSTDTQCTVRARRAPQRAPRVHDLDEVVHKAADLVLEQVAAAADQREAQHQAQRRELGAAPRVQALARGGARAVAAAARARLLAQRFPARERGPRSSPALCGRPPLRSAPRTAGTGAASCALALASRPHGRPRRWCCCYVWALSNLQFTCFLHHQTEEHARIRVLQPRSSCRSPKPHCK